MKLQVVDLGVSKNRGTPKWMVYDGQFLFFNGWFWGKTHYFRKSTHLEGQSLELHRPDLQIRPFSDAIASAVRAHREPVVESGWIFGPLRRHVEDTEDAGSLWWAFGMGRVFFMGSVFWKVTPGMSRTWLFCHQFPMAHAFVGFRGLLMGYWDPDQNTCSKYIFFLCAQARSLISHSNQRYQWHPDTFELKDASHQRKPYSVLQVDFSQTALCLALARSTLVEGSGWGGRFKGIRDEMGISS